MLLSFLLFPLFLNMNFYGIPDESFQGVEHGIGFFRGDLESLEKLHGWWGFQGLNMEVLWNLGLTVHQPRVLLNQI